MQRIGQEAGCVVSAGASRSFESILVRQCAPTLAGMKPGSIFCIKPSRPEAVRRKAQQWNERLAPLGISVQILLERSDSGLVIVYVYRRSQLEQIVSDTGCRKFLEQTGYPKKDLTGLLAHRVGGEKHLPALYPDICD